MQAFQLRPLRAPLSRFIFSRPLRRWISASTRAASNSSIDRTATTEDLDVAELLKRPVWSVSSLLFDKNHKTAELSAITISQLHHLLRLSALPLPASPKLENAKLDTLRTQLRFVRDVQNLDTTGLQPLQCIRDETSEAMKDHSISVKTVEQTLLQEESFGRNRRPRRRITRVDVSGVGDWDPLSTASQTAGQYIVVNGADR